MVSFFATAVLAFSGLGLLSTVQSAAVEHGLYERKGGGGGDGTGAGPADDDPTTGFPGPTTGIPGSVTAAACSAYIPLMQQIMTDLFGGTCNDNARAALRLAFTDAATFTLAGGSIGGADGSILLDPNEASRPENQGLVQFIGALKPIIGLFTASTADVVQLAGTLSVVVCPGAPRVIPFFMGRKDATTSNPTGLIPNPSDPVAMILARFADMGFSAEQTAALLGAHTIARQAFVDPAFDGAGMDSTMNIWDASYFSETLTAAAINDTFSATTGVFHLESDLKMSLDPSTGPFFQFFARDQAAWAAEFIPAFAKFNVLGQNTSALIQCDGLIPVGIDISVFKDPTTGVIDQFALTTAVDNTFGTYFGRV